MECEVVGSNPPNPNPNPQPNPNPNPNPDPDPNHNLHSVSVVAVVSERQGENHFSLNQNPIAQPDRARGRNWGLGRKAAPDEYPHSLMVDND